MSERNSSKNKKRSCAVFYLLVLLAAFECSDGVLVEIRGEGDTLGDLGWRWRSLKDSVILRSIGGLLTGSSC